MRTASARPRAGRAALRRPRAEKEKAHDRRIHRGGRAGQNAWYQLREGESGQGLVEYALIIALVSLAAVGALGFLSGKINNLFSKAGNVLNNGIRVPS